MRGQTVQRDRGPYPVRKGDSTSVTERQRKVLSLLPDKTGWFWVSNNKTGIEWSVFFDRAAAAKPDCYDIYVINYGNLISGCDLNANLIVSWFEENTVLGYIEPFKHPEQNETFGAF